ncbi:hypothetical protein HK101_005939 [Irineochytrium annulatum]|nr:hypothetical protein HK101_005939 [Irineochytrium annulatum]
MGVIRLLALWCLGCIGIIYASYHAGIYARHNGPYSGQDVHMYCDGVCVYEMPAWWAKDVLVEQRGTYDAFLLKERPSTVAASFGRNVFLDNQRDWGWNDHSVVQVKLLQRGGEKFNFDVNLPSESDFRAQVTNEMFNPVMDTYLFQLTVQESGRYEARVPEFTSTTGAFPVHLRFTLGPNANEWSTAAISASGETYRYNVAAAESACPSTSRTPEGTPCAFTSPSPFRPSYVIFQDIEGPVGNETTFVSLRERPRIIAVISFYAPYGLIILTALVTIAVVLWNRKTPVEAWREWRVQKDVGTEDERQPIFGEGA